MSYQGVIVLVMAFLGLRIEEKAVDEAAAVVVVGIGVCEGSAWRGRVPSDGGEDAIIDVGTIGTKTQISRPDRQIARGHGKDLRIRRRGTAISYESFSHIWQFSMRARVK